ncbi:MAG: carbon-nitrogen hydrolase family protein [Deltaproteobacteria bacterium]|nr:carbon-nitrogen hydrolase family protein [Deltaproteobacteria bacterium]
MPESIRAAVIQMCSRKNVAANLDQACTLCQQAHDQGAQLIVLPENFPLIATLKDKVNIAEDLKEPGPILERMTRLARDLQVSLLLGGVPMRAAPGRCFNTSILVDAEGLICASYRKIHLFDIAIPDGAVFQESALVEAGKDVVTAEILGCRLGMTICYDLRFPELYRALVDAGCQVVSVPAAFTLHTGKDHWIPLLRARAIENQVYILAANQYGRHTPERFSYGKSCIIDPWGAIVAQVSDGDGVAVADLDLDYVKKVREELPCLNHRRI